MNRSSVQCSRKPSVRFATLVNSLPANSLFAVFFLAFSGTCVYAEQVMRLESVVTGNQEQPKVMFVMPWQPIPTPEYDPEQAALLMPQRLLKSYDAGSLVRYSERALVKVPPFVKAQD